MHAEWRKSSDRRKLMKRLPVLLLAAVALVSLAGCAAKKSTTGSTEDKTYEMYYMNVDQDELVSETYVPGASDADGLIREFISGQERSPKKKDQINLLPEGTKITGFERNGSTLSLQFDDSYKAMKASREVLTRAGLVHTFTQIDGVNDVNFYVGGQPLTDSLGNVVGNMTVDSFVEKYGESINSYQKVEMTLYFTNETGSALVPEQRTVYYSTSEPLERAVVDEILKGPQENGHYPTFSAGTNVLSVLTQGEICYVNFDDSVKNTILSLKEEIPIYSIVDSLSETCKVSKVQFTINGENNVTFRENMDLSKTYKEDTSLIQN